MTSRLGEPLRAALASLDPASPRYATEAVDRLLAEARAAGTSDVHLHPEADSVLVRWRVDGVLHEAARLPKELGPNIAARLKVLADLLTYRVDVPQEGRIRGDPGMPETRVSSFPTLHGERVVIRLFPAGGPLERIHHLGLPPEVGDQLLRLLEETSGMIVLAGPAGSGKTTTLYACLREAVALSAGSRSIATLEDPIEVAIPGVAQSQVHPEAGFTLESGLRSLMRQDPEVIGVGEIRDRATAEVAIQASLTGHLVLTTFHAGSSTGALSRLLDMGIEPYLIRSGVLAVLFQRLARRLCTCAVPAREPRERPGPDSPGPREPQGCPECRMTGYRGRFVLAELALPDRGELGRALLARADRDTLERAAAADGVVSRRTRAVEAVSAGLTTAQEVRRVLGLEESRTIGNSEFRR